MQEKWSSHLDIPNRNFNIPKQWENMAQVHYSMYLDDCKHMAVLLFLVLGSRPGAEREELSRLQRVLMSDITESEHQLRHALTVEPHLPVFSFILWENKWDAGELLCKSCHV